MNALDIAIVTALFVLLTIGFVVDEVGRNRQARRDAESHLRLMREVRAYRDPNEQP